jgi:hypothetical protein
MRYSPEKFQQLAALVENGESYTKTKLLKELLDSMYKFLPS